MRVNDIAIAERLLTAHDVMHLTGFKSRATLWRKSKDENDPFPTSYTYNGHFTRWKHSEIKSWMSQLERA